MKLWIERKTVQLVFISSTIVLLMLFPFKFQLLKLLLITLTIWVTRKNLCVKQKLILWTIFFVILNICSITYGLINGNPGVVYYIPIYLLWPILFLVWSGCMNRELLHTLLNVCWYCTWMIIILGLIAFLKLNIEMNLSGSFLMFEASIRPGFPFIAISSPLVTTFLFWYFFFFTLILVNCEKIDYKKSFFILLGVIFIFATSRRVILVSFIMIFILILLMLSHLNESKKIKLRVYNSIFIISVFVLSSLYVAIACGLMDNGSMMEFFNKTSEASDSERILQLNSLLEGWMDSPVFGQGTGVNAKIIRSNIPGTYELTYFAKLFETGLIGIVIYFWLWGFLFYWTYRCVYYKFIPSKYIIALLSAMTIFMISNSTNPYLGAFDYMWFMYIPFAIINVTQNKLIKDGQD